MKVPSLLPMSASVSSFQYSTGREYILIQIGAQLKSSLSGLNLGFHSVIYSPEELKKYGPPSNIHILSSTQWKMAVKKPFGPSCRVTCPLGFHLEAIHPCKAFSVGQNPRNFPMSAWSYMCWISPLMRWLGRSTLIRSAAFGIHVAEVAFGCDDEALLCASFSEFTSAVWVVCNFSAFVLCSSCAGLGPMPKGFRGVVFCSLSEIGVSNGGEAELSPPTVFAIAGFQQEYQRRRKLKPSEAARVLKRFASG